MKKRSHWPISVLSSITAILNALLPLLMVRILTPHDIGIFRIFFLYVSMIPAFSLTSGFTSGLAYWAGRGEEGRKAIRMSGLFTLIASAAFWLLALTLQGPIAKHFEWPALYAMIFSFSVFCATSNAFFEEAAIATGRIWTGALFLSGFELVRTTSILATAYFTHDLKSILLVHSGMMLAKILTGYIMGYNMGLFGFGFERGMFRSMWKYSFPVSLAWMFGVFINYGDQFVLSNFITPAEFALYTIGCLVVPPILIIEQSVTRVMIPQMSEAFTKGESSRAASLYRGGVSQMAMLFIPAVTGLLVFADPIVELLFTAKYAAAASYLRIYALGYLLLVIPYDAVPRARALGGWILRNFIFFSIMSLTMCFGLTKLYGAFGALGGIIATRTAMKAYSIWYVRASTGWKIEEFLPLGAFGRYAVVCLVLGAGAMALRPMFPSQLMWFIGAGALFSALYFALVLPWNKAAAARVVSYG